MEEKMAAEDDRQIIISYTNLRRLIGILGISLPFLCLIGLIITSTILQPSISHCYYTNVRDVFVGIMIGVSMFLITYYGYDPIDHVVTNITGTAGILLAICPCLFSYANPELNHLVGYLNFNPYLSNIIHIVCASIFFLLLAFNSIFLFTKTDPNVVKTENKKKRNVIYIVCGIIMIVLMLVLLFLHLIMGNVKFDETPIAFFIESLMLLAFGISWLVKGDTIFRD
jgi:hypothetical protein